MVLMFDGSLLPILAALVIAGLIVALIVYEVRRYGRRKFNANAAK